MAHIYTAEICKGRNTKDYAVFIRRVFGKGLFDYTDVAFRVFRTRKEANRWSDSVLKKLAA